MKLFTVCVVLVVAVVVVVGGGCVFAALARIKAVIVAVIVGDGVAVTVAFLLMLM